ncbi:MAG: ABC transporter substrate-binding protein [bacterium]
MKRAAFIIICLFLPVAASVKPKYDGFITLEMSFVNSSITEIMDCPHRMLENIYEPLVTADKDSPSVRGQLSTCQYLAGYNGISILLNDSAKFSNGDFLSSYDIINGWLKIIIKNPYKYNALLGNVKGYEEILQEKSNTISGFKIIDNRTIAVEFIKPDSQFHIRLALQGLPAVKSVRQNSYFIGTGPFKVNNFTPDRLGLERNPFYRFAPAFPRAADILLKREKNRFLSFQTMKYDGISIFLNSDYDYIKQYVKKPFKLAPVSRLFFFLKLNPALDMESRKYLASCIDKNAIFHALIQAKGLISGGLVSDIQTGTVVPDVHGTLQRPVKIIIRNGDKYLKTCADGIFAQLLKSGIKSDITEYECKDFYKKSNDGDYDIILENFKIGNDIDKGALRLFYTYFSPVLLSMDIKELSRYEDLLKTNVLYLPLFEIHESMLCHDYVRNISASLDNIWKLE